MLSMDQIKNDLRALIIEAPDRVFAAAKAQIPETSKKMKTLMLLEGRYKDLLNKVQKGVIASEDQSLEINRIREQLLLWIEDLEEKDLVTKDVRSKKSKPYPLLILLALMAVVALIWAAWYLQPFGSMEKKLDTAETTASHPAPSPEILEDGSSGQTDKKALDGPVREVAKDQAESTKAVHVKLEVLPLWKDSDIIADGKAVEPLERVGTYITLALSPGSHKIRLVSGQDRCEKNIMVREEGAVIPFVCD
jgi:hypothetical protein